MQILAPSRAHAAPSVGRQRGPPAGLPARSAPRVRTRGSLPSSGRLEDAEWVPRRLEARQAAVLDETPSPCLAGSIGSHERELQGRAAETATTISSPAVADSAQLVEPSWPGGLRSLSSRP